MKTTAAKTDKLIELLLTFAKIGFFTFGGGYAMLAIIENICVERKKWITPDEMARLTVVAESTPGPIAINCATYIGYRIAGFAGAVFATLGIVLPSFVIIFSISRFLDNFLEIGIVASAFRGIRLAIGVLIFEAAVKMMRKIRRDAVSVAILVTSFLVMLAVDLFAWSFSSVSLMLVAAFVSLLIFFIRNRKRGGSCSE